MVRSNLSAEIARLSAAERILLAQDLWDSVADDSQAWTMTPQQADELDRRLAAFQRRDQRGKNTGASWSQVKRRVRRKS